MSIIGALVSIVYNVFFMRGEEGFRRVESFSKLIFILCTLTLMFRRPDRVIITGFITLLLGLYYPGMEWALSTLVLTSILGAYMGLSTLLSNFLGWSSLSIFQVFMVVVRTISFSTTIIFIVAILSPRALSNILRKIGLKKLVVHIPILIWRLIPYGMKWFTESLMIGYLKNERVTTRIPVVAAGVIEVGQYLEEYSYYRLNSEMKKPILLVKEEYTSDIILIVVSFLMLLLL
ncbi:hypothetical protein [Thermosphaera aggregans]|uniref:Cobalt transport protein n=1 Tax=Thermosphaera aggregans (strain DSM 11486 / M11TL) TaxID=633148 RepID=D5U0H9_THEAM|nr:hypothetical protein [Thermosphaera aggregans]ADG90629.1 hypothetical protein Tagg_0354 [Thermosphaera aggregans DSM 11486]